ncbi:MAG TPA: hypothetical protein VHB77_05050 [Planctomycetaceae bacterium]|nr:hypothetical protein [Planctomycetaceae bacterium]
MSQYQQEAQGIYEEAIHQAGEAIQQTEEIVRRNPGYSALVTFGVGFGVGMLMTAVLTPESRRERRGHRMHEFGKELNHYLPEWLSLDQLTDAVARVLPSAMSQLPQSIQSAIRR